MKMDPQRFIAEFSRWGEYFIQGGDQPVLGASEEDLKSITVPA